MTGKVKWYNLKKGYGFIVGENNEDIFIHYSVLEKSNIKKLNVDDVVTYQAIETENGLLAVNIEKTELIAV